MKILKLAVTGQTRLAARVVHELYELGHTILLADTRDGPLGDACAKLGIAATGAQTDMAESFIACAQLGIPAEVVDARLDDPEWLIVCGAADAPPVCPSAGTLALAITSTTPTNGVHVEWRSSSTMTEPLSLAATRLHFESPLSGADRVREIEECAVRLLCDICTRLARRLEPAADVIAERNLDDAPLDLVSLAAWHPSNESHRAFTLDASLPEMIQRAAAEFPDRVAVIDASGPVTYASLLGAAAEVEQALLERFGGSQPQQAPVVAVRLGKSATLYAAILGVLSAGAAYLPLDPTFPPKRVDVILTEARAGILITDSDFEYAPDDASCIEILRLAPIDFATGARAGLRCAVAAVPDRSGRSAVVIFTSGSTGKPKGVLLSHANVVHFSHWYRDHVGLNASSRALQFSTVAFDASLLDMFPTWLAGGALVVPTEEERRDLDKLQELIDRQKVSHAFLPPALLGSLPDAGLPTLEHLVTGGDVCDPDTIARWSANRSLHNIYGPTECTVLASTAVLRADDDRWNIGKPIANVTCHVLDETLQPVRTGEAGELYIGGAGVGLGYIGQPELTAERFLRNPFAAPGAGRLFRTGDLVRWETSGTLRFIGRRDSQIKIRGFRVELGEIESAVLATGLFRHAAAVVDQRKQIIAFVAKPARANASGDAVRKALERQLPDYMVPRRVIVVDALPSTNNGKIDRAMLTTVVPRHESNAEIDATPFNAIEAQLRAIWAELLDIDAPEIGRRVSFFELGGHSLLVSKLMLAVKRRFSGGAPLARFMECPTIEALAGLLTDERQAKGARVPVRAYEDMRLPEDIAAPGGRTRPAEPVRNVLLTGATGFLGGAILNDLLASTAATVHCLVRAPSQKEAVRKLQESLAQSALVPEEAYSRVNAVRGDLAASGLGLTGDEQRRLADTIDAIYHNGAHVNHVYDYAYLFRENVGSTLELLRLASVGRPKSLHFVSTLSAASAVGPAGRILETGPAETPPVFVNNGYNLSKWVSEHLVWQAASRGIDTTILRPGNIVGHSLSGACSPQRNRLLLLLKGSLQLAFAPALEAAFDLSPVDFVARAIVAVTVDTQRTRRVFHVHNPSRLTWNAYLQELQRLGYELALEDPARWHKRLLSIDEANALFDVVAFYLDDRQEDIGDMSLIDYRQTARELERLGVTYTSVDAALLETHFRYLIQCGFLPAPPSLSLSHPGDVHVAACRL